MTATREEKFNAFRALHQRPGVFVIPNPWDAGSAKILAALGFEALATTSAGCAFSRGYLDSAPQITRDVVLQNAREIVEATTLPVSADLQNGFGHDPKTCAETIRLAANAGLTGGSIEDSTGDSKNPIYDFQHATERVAAAAEAAHASHFLLTARAENFLHGRPDLDDTIRRLQSFAKAGADVLYAPGLSSVEAIRTVCASVSKPVNVLLGLPGSALSVEEVAAVGVKRISVGGSFARAALGGLVRAAREVKEKGTFSYTADALPSAETKRYLASPAP
jgi:2-methylisocitrate lyase-like PEP mutase family enzyme